MALEEVSGIDLVQVLLDGELQVRRADRILKDGVEIAKSYHRHVVVPGDDLSGQDARVQAIAKAIWTPAVVVTYKKKHE